MSTESETDETPGQVPPPRDPPPETEAGDDEGSGGSDQPDTDDVASSDPEAIENDPSTAGGPQGDLPEGTERLRGG
jgi:hypothetical protein